MKLNNVFFLCVMMLSCEHVFGMEMQVYGLSEPHAQKLVALKKNNEFFKQQIALQRELLKTLEGQSQETSKKTQTLEEKIHSMENIVQQMLLVQAKLQENMTQLALHQANNSAPQNITINTVGGTATSSSNPTTTTTQTTETKVENNFWQSDKMKLRCSVLSAALLFGLSQGGPEGGAAATITAIGMLYAVHSIQNKIKVFGTFTLMTASSFAAMIMSSDKEAIKAMASLFIMSFCGTILVGVLSP